MKTNQIYIHLVVTAGFHLSVLAYASLCHTLSEQVRTRHSYAFEHRSKLGMRLYHDYNTNFTNVIFIMNITHLSKAG